MGLRSSYMFIRSLETDPVKFKDAIIEEKKLLRKELFTQMVVDPFLEYTRFDEDGYSVVKRYGFQDCFFDTDEDVNKYVREHYTIDPWYSDYDCTGRPFTSWWSIFKVQGKWVAYVCTCRDV